MFVLCTPRHTKSHVISPEKCVSIHCIQNGGSLRKQLVMIIQTFLLNRSRLKDPLDGDTHKSLLSVYGGKNLKKNDCTNLSCMSCIFLYKEIQSSLKKFICNQIEVGESCFCDNVGMVCHHTSMLPGKIS